MLACMSMSIVRNSKVELHKMGQVLAHLGRTRTLRAKDPSELRSVKISSILLLISCLKIFLYFWKVGVCALEKCWQRWNYSCSSLHYCNSFICCLQRVKQYHLWKERWASSTSLKNTNYVLFCGSRIVHRSILKSATIKETVFYYAPIDLLGIYL